MIFQIYPSKDFRKTVKKYQRAGKKQILNAITEVAQLLVARDLKSQLLLSTHWRDHPLKGDKRGKRELHLSLDDLLVYEIQDEHGKVILVDIVSHEELRKKW